MWEAVEALARLSAEDLEDTAAATVGILFDEWKAGTAYVCGARISDGDGNLYRVVQDHMAQADWPIESTPSLYTPLGVTTEEPNAVPQWKQPLGAQDAYAKGDKAYYNGELYVSLIDSNVFAPDVSGWEVIAV